MQGFNMGRYYPPDASNPPTFNKSHPLGARASKISQGALTVRFELPFAVWCQHCKPEAVVGQGVRFNAAKKKIGNYYSTPIWSFKMKHTACGGEWEIKTDPKTTQYICVGGCRKRDYGPEDDGVGSEGEMRILSKEEKTKRRDDAFAGLEGKLEDKARDEGNRERVEELYDKAKVWRDPYDVNARLRRAMRDKRRAWNKEEKQREDMQYKFSLGLEIADETDADRQRAALVDFGAGMDQAESWRPFFVDTHTESIDTSHARLTNKSKAEVVADKNRKALQQKLVGNTRGAVDPFVSRQESSRTKPNFGILKRKRDSEVILGRQVVPSDPDTLQQGDLPAQKPVALVGYDSD